MIFSDPVRRRIYKELQESVRYIKRHLRNSSAEPETGIVLGTGLGGLIQSPVFFTELEIPYEKIPHFPVSTVEGHKGKLIFGSVYGRKVIVMQGRFHAYEGYSMQKVVYPVRVMKLFGIRTLILSNAAGGLSARLRKGDLMIIRDHINLQTLNPLTGENIDEFGPRFPDMSEPYSRYLLGKAVRIAGKLKIRVQTGIYAAVNGPSLETPAEYRYLNRIGADAVGMSTVPEVIAANHMSLPAFAVSIITDIGYPGKPEKVEIEKIIAVAAKAEPKMTQLIAELIKETGK